MRCSLAILARWRERRDTLRKRLAARDADHWMWSIRLRILDYLLARYDRGYEGPVAEDQSLPGASRSRMPPVLHTGAPDPGPHRSAGSTRAALERLRRINRESGIKRKSV